jgi:hypothetical protein
MKKRFPLLRQKPQENEPQIVITTKCMLGKSREAFIHEKKISFEAKTARE